MGRLKMPEEWKAAAPWEQSVHWGPTGWKGLQNTPAKHQQNGVYLDAILSQYPARWEGAQLWGGVRSFYPGWLVPSRSSVPSFQQTTQNKSMAGSAQRDAGKPGNPAAVGPLAARQMRQNVLSAQVAQSGLQTLSWAQQLKAWGSGGGA